MAEVVGLLLTACVNVAKMIYDEIRRMQDQARLELIRAERELMSATGCAPQRRPSYDSDSDEEEEPVAVQTKKPQRVAILVVAVAIASHILRTHFRREL